MDPRRVTRRRKAALAIVVWLAAFEGAAWIADAWWGFRYELLDGIETARTQTTPVAEEAPEWPRGVLRVRVPDRGEPRAEPYALGGRVIEGAWPDAKQEWLYPSDLGGGRRVFVLGGSAPLGYPYPYEASFARRLGRALPDHQVINVGQAGWTSGQVLGAARVVVGEFEPDVLVIYSGNNEWIRWAPQPRGVDLDWQARLAHSRALAGALWLGHRLRARQPPPAEAPPLVGWRHAVAHPDRELDVDGWRRQRGAHLDMFRANLVAMRDLATARGARVVFCTVPFNYRLAPDFKHPQPDAFEPARAAEVRRAIGAAADALEAEQPSRALEATDAAIALDADPAVLHYLRGAALEALDRMPEAERAYAESRDRMVGNLGARLAINRVIREVATGEGVTLLDLRRRFDEAQHARGGWLNEDLVHDDCHPTPAGHAIIADALADLLRDGA